MRRLLLLLLLALTGTAAHADAPVPLGHAAGPLAIHAAPGGASPAIGRILTAAPLTALGPAGAGWRPVAVTGWTMEGAERALQAAPGLRVTRAVLAPGALAALAFGPARVLAETGQSWRRTTLTGWIADDAAALSPDLATLWTRAEALFTSRCTTCHVRRIPHHYSANQWTSHIKVMGPRTGLPREDQALIAVFLQYHSSDAAALTAALAED